MSLEERLNIYPDRNYDGMEDWYHLRDRVQNKVKTLAKKHHDKNLLIISHGGAINALLYTLSNGQYGSGITKLHMGSVNMLLYEDNRLLVEYYNRKVY